MNVLDWNVSYVKRSWSYGKVTVFSFNLRSLKTWNIPSINVGFANGAEVDLKIEENFKESDLVAFLRNYADLNGVGANILTREFC